MIPFRELCVKEITGTCDATPGTRSSHAHGQNKIPDIDRCLVFSRGVVGDADDAGVINIVSVDITNIVVKSNKASQLFTILLLLQEDTGGRNLT